MTALRYWTPSEEAIVRQHYPHQRTADLIALLPGRTERTIYQKASALGLSKDGYLLQKTTDDQRIVPARRWVAVHRLVWIAANGSVPAGHIVSFKPGCRTNVLEQITADRLECISRAANAIRNHPRAKSPELGVLTQLKGAITRQVNRITREAQENTAP